MDWPNVNDDGVYVVVFMVTDNPVLNNIRNRYAQKIEFLIMTNPEMDFSVMDRVITKLQNHPVMSINETQYSINRKIMATQDLAQLFISYEKPYQLALVYEFQCGMELMNEIEPHTLTKC